MFDDLRPELSIYGRKHMITPNFERLAEKSVVFDYAFCQVAVCNPSRDSLLTGLRPDTVGTYGFQSSYRPHLALPTQLVRSGFNTAGIGKIVHWEMPDPDVWNFHSFDNGWYDYQNKERSHMNSSTMPDRVQKEENFRDYEFTTRAIEVLGQMASKPEYFMLGLGFKLPHLAVHVPYKYYEMYKSPEKIESWKLHKKELRYPYSTPSVGYRCCAEQEFRFMNEEGSIPASKTHPLADINMAFTEKMYDELMMGYCGAVSFLDAQLGRLLDAIDKLSLWGNLTVVLTADHGMHNGEKGLWEKWTLFDEATRIPLIISHPRSPFKGQHYPYPVELVDVYKTVQDLIAVPFNKTKVCTPDTICHPLQGKSLAPVVLGVDQWRQIHPHINIETRRMLSDQENEEEGEEGEEEWSGVTGDLDSPSLLVDSKWDFFIESDHRQLNEHSLLPAVSPVSPSPSVPKGMPIFKHNFAISQNWRCAKKSQYAAEETLLKEAATQNVKAQRTAYWVDCDKTQKPTDEISVLGYSMRTPEFRFTAWIHVDRERAVPMLDVPPFLEELYDHRHEKLSDFTHLEIQNLIGKPGFETITNNLRNQLIDFIKHKIVFRGPFDRRI